MTLATANGHCGVNAQLHVAWERRQGIELATKTVLVQMSTWLLVRVPLAQVRIFQSIFCINPDIAFLKYLTQIVYTHQYSQSVLTYLKGLLHL